MPESLEDSLFVSDHGKISGLFVYPVKGCRGCEVESITFDAHGPVNDRRWILIDEHSQMVTQRNAPPIAIVRVSTSPDHSLQVTVDAQSPLSIPVPPTSVPALQIRVWNDPVWGRDGGDDAAAWFSAIAGKPVRLLHLASENPRQRVWQEAAYTVGFADGYPLLICNEASLKDLNRRLLERASRPVSMDRFRPNVVIRGPQAWAEDRWTYMQTPAGQIRCATGCARCTVTTVDQTTGKIPIPAEPLATLALFRKEKRGILFGRNALGLRPGAALKTGDTVTF